MRTVRPLSMLVSIALVLAACTKPNTADTTDTSSDPIATSAQTSTNDSTGEDESEPITLLMASPYGSFNYTPAVGLFVDNVEELSAGNLAIVTNHSFGNFEPDAEQKVVQAVAAGDVDLAWVGTRVFDTLGVTSFQALHAPFLVDSYALQQAVIDSDIPSQMLEGLDELGVIGLALLAGGLRHPIAVENPILDVNDWAGITVQHFRSTVQSDTITALGSEPSDVGPGGRDTGIADGSIHAIENTLLTYVINSMWTMTPYLTTNVTLWPETTVLLANPETLAGLTSVQAGWLEEAAESAAARSVELHDVDADLAAEACEKGARFAEASEEELAALRDATEPVYDQLRSDPLTAELIDQIQEMKQSVTVADLVIPDGCTGEAPTQEIVVAEGTDDPSVINGTYRLEWDADELFEAFGVDDPEIAPLLQRDAANNAGVSILTFNDGQYDQIAESGPSAGSNCPGTYAISGNRITMVASSDPTEWDCGRDSLGLKGVDAAWELTDQGLLLSDFTLSEEPDVTWWNAVFFSKQLMRVD